MSKENPLKAEEVKAKLDIVADKIFAYGSIKSHAHDNVKETIKTAAGLNAS